MSLIESIANECGNSKPTPGGYSCRCPQHETGKSTNSAKVYMTPDDKVGITCYSGCEGRPLFDALRTVSRTFFEWDREQHESYKEKKRGNKPAKQGAGKATGELKVKSVEDWRNTVKWIGATPYRKEFAYRDENGDVLYYEFRYDFPDGSKQLRPLAPVDEARTLFIQSMTGVRRVLYNLPEILAGVKVGRSVHLAEGAKCADVLIEWGFAGTAILGGAKKDLSPEMIEHLKGCRFVAIVVDLDKPGLLAGHRKAMQLHAAGIIVKWVVLPGLGEIQEEHGKDIYDWKQEGHTDDEYEALVNGLPDWKPEDTAHYDKQRPGEKIVSKTAEERKPLDDDDLEKMPFTDAANGYRLFKHTDGKAVFVPQSDKHRPWWLYNGKHWENDKTARMMLIAQESAHRMYKELRETNVDQTKLNAWYQASLMRSGGSNAIALAQPYCGFNITDFDADPHLLNCLSGIIDLRTGERMDHDPALYCSQMVPVEWKGLDYQAPSDNWREFQKWAHDGDTEVMEFMHRWKGYCLSGLTGEQKFILYYGKKGANGKSIVIENQLRMAGSYGFAGNCDLVMERRNPSKEANPAQIVGKRIITIDEIGKKDKFDDARIRAFTGEDMLTGSNLYAAPFNFYPVGKLVMRGNEKPYLEGGDSNEPTWRRFIFVEFRNTMPEKQRRRGLGKNFWDNHKEEMLAEAVRGAIDACDTGIQIPSVLLSGLDELRKETNLFADFVEWICMTGDGCECTRGEFIEAFNTYLHRLGWRESWFPQRIGREVTALGVTRGQMPAPSKEPSYRGIQLRADWREVLAPQSGGSSRYSSGQRTIQYS